MPFSFFDHTGDIGVDLSAADLPGLFVAAAEALSETLTSLDGIEPRLQRPISLEATATDLLLVDWVSELVYRFDAFEWLTRNAQVRVVGAGAWRLEATLRGETRDPARHPLKVLVKAVTYHELALEQRADGWHARLVLDI